MSTFEELYNLFSQNNIDCRKVGFCDSPNFLKAEREDPVFLRNYGEFIDKRSRTAAYEEYVRTVTKVIVDIVYQELVAEGRLGACVDLSMVLQRMLEAEGIWSYCVSGGLHIRFLPSTRLEDVYFYILDMQNITGHAWVCAPPYDVIDVTIHQQKYFQSQARSYIPPFNVFSGKTVIRPDLKEICSPEIRALAKAQKKDLSSIINVRIPDYADTASLFPAYSHVIDNGTEFRYIPAGIAVSDVPLSKITNQKWNGRLGYDLYMDLVRPALDSYRVSDTNLL